MEFRIVRNDITDMAVDAVVLAANSKLKEGKGLSKDIFEAAGRKELKKACKNAVEKFGKVDVGDSVPTLGYQMECNYIIHTIVPKWKNGKRKECDLLSLSYLSALELADKLNCESVAFPLLSSGNSGFDLFLAYQIAKESIDCFEPNNKLKEVFLVVYDMDVMAMLRNEGEIVEELIDDVAILKKEDMKQLPKEMKVEKGKQFVQKHLENGVNVAKDFLADPERKEELLKIGANIAVNAFDTAIKNKKTNKLK